MTRMRAFFGGISYELFELKLNGTAKEALQQIEDKGYAATLHATGVTAILKMAITFDGKRVGVKTAEEN